MNELTIGELCWLWHHVDDWARESELCDKLRSMIDAKSERDLSDNEIREIASEWRRGNL